jgi:hypothetical protein
MFLNEHGKCANVTEISIAFTGYYPTVVPQEVSFNFRRGTQNENIACMEFWAQHSHTLDRLMSSLLDKAATQGSYSKLLHKSYKQ